MSNTTFRKHILLIVLSFGGFTSLARADSNGGLFVEPALTYENGSNSINFPSPLSDSSGNITGFGIGARVGFHLSDAFFAGIDARYAMPKFTDSSVSYDAKAVAFNWGPTVGLQMPGIGLRVWGTYVLDGYLDPEKSGNFDVKFEKATGTRFGAGFRILALSLNLEYQQVKYGQTDFEQIGPLPSGTTGSNTQLTNKTWIASVSFPMTF